MLPQKPSRKSQYVKPKRKTRKRAHAHLFSEPNPTSACLPFPYLRFPHHSKPPPFCGCGWGILRFMKQLRVAFAVRKQKHKQKQNKTKRNQLESSRVELSWAKQRAANSNLTPSGQAVGQVGQLDSLPIADYCNVVVWHAGQCTSHAHSGLRRWVIKRIPACAFY